MKIQYKPTPNTYDFNGAPIGLELHTTLGSLESAVDWLRMTPEQRKKLYGKETYSSANVVFGRNGEIVELAGVDKATWHAGGVSKPSPRAKKLIPRTITGGIKNPNKYMLGYEFASGYDIDKDGILETWEKLYTPQQIKASVWYTINRVEPQILEKWGVRREFTADDILTHKDTAIYKPDLEIQRAMFIAELSKQRSNTVKPVQAEELLVLKDGDTFTVGIKGKNVTIKKL